MIKYFVSYSWSNGTNAGMGNSEIQRNQPVRSKDDIVSMQNSILKDCFPGASATIVILYFKRFEKRY